VTTGGKGGALNIEYNAHLSALTPFHNNVKLTLQNGKQLTVDAVIFATGVEPNTQFLTAETADAGLKLSAQDGGIVVDQFMQTSVAGIYAAGDVCSIEWQHGQSPPSLWFQMRLWTQARQMGCQCAQTMLNELSSSATDGSFENNFTMAFELFAHTTVFFGFKVVLLGRFNDGETTNEVLIRCTPGQEYIKVILDRNGRMVGAMLIGETDLEVHLVTHMNEFHIEICRKHLRI
jgi:NAD(P)H-nitrite reductase large subunit